MIKLRPNPRKGFTMVELLLVILIIGILTTIVTIDFRSGKMRQDLKQAALDLSGSLRKVQNMAMTGQTMLIGEVEEVPLGGYGLFFNLPAGEYNKFYLFGDTFPDPPDHRYESGKDWLVEEQEVVFPAGVVIEEIRHALPLPVNPYYQKVSIVFKPLEREPFVCLDTICDVVTLVEIQLKHQQIDNIKYLIKLNIVTGLSEAELIEV